MIHICKYIQRLAYIIYLLIIHTHCAFLFLSFPSVKIVYQQVGRERENILFEFACVMMLSSCLLSSLKRLCYVTRDIETSAS